MSWYKTGKFGEEAARQHDEEVAKRMSAPRRFWLKPDSSKTIVFLDSDGFFLREHQAQDRNGKWGNFFTCLADVPGAEDCPACEAGVPFSFVCAFTIIDIGTYQSRKGDPIVNPKQLLVLKSTARSKVFKQKERREGNLVGCKFEVSRFTSKDLSTGSDFEFIERMTRKQLEALCPDKKKAAEYLLPVDYIKAFAPVSAAEMRRAINLGTPVGSGDAPYNGHEAELEEQATTEESDLKDIL